jgi:hypothetical protein
VRSQQASGRKRGKAQAARRVDRPGKRIDAHAISPPAQILAAAREDDDEDDEAAA